MKKQRDSVALLLIVFILSGELFWLYKLSSRSGQESDSEAEDIEHAEKLRQVKAVLEEVHLHNFEATDLHLRWSTKLCL